MYASVGEPGKAVNIFLKKFLKIFERKIAFFSLK